MIITMSITKAIRRMLTRRQQANYTQNVDFFSSNFSKNTCSAVVKISILDVLRGPGYTSQKQFVKKKRFESNKEELCFKVFALNLTNVFVQKIFLFCSARNDTRKDSPEFLKKECSVKMSDNLGKSPYFRRRCMKLQLDTLGLNKQRIMLRFFLFLNNIVFLKNQ